MKGILFSVLFTALCYFLIDGRILQLHQSLSQKICAKSGWSNFAQAKALLTASLLGTIANAIFVIKPTGIIQSCMLLVVIVLYIIWYSFLRNRLIKADEMAQQADSSISREISKTWSVFNFMTTFNYSFFASNCYHLSVSIAGILIGIVFFSACQLGRCYTLPTREKVTVKNWVKSLFAKLAPSTACTPVPVPVKR